MDEKQWLVSRLDTATKTIFDEFQLSKEELVRIRGELTTSTATKRNIILSVAGFIVSLLVGLYETQWIDRILFLEILIPVLSTGIATLLLSSLFIKSDSEAFIRVENATVTAQQALNHNFGQVKYSNREKNRVITVPQESDMLIFVMDKMVNFHHK